MTARDIVKALGEKHSRCGDFYIAEVKNGATWTAKKLRIMDFVAIKKSWVNPCITVYEIKTSRSDFLGDNKWPDYLPYCHKFMFACPKGLISRKDIETLGYGGVGLIHINDNLKYHTVKAPLLRKCDISRDFLLYIIMNRLVPQPKDKEERIQIWQEWLEGRRTSRTLGYKVKSAMVSRLADLEQQVDRFKHIEQPTKQMREDYRKLGLHNSWERKRIMGLLNILGNSGEIARLAALLDMIAVTGSTAKKYLERLEKEDQDE